MDKWTALRFSPACQLTHRPDDGDHDHPSGKVSFEATIGASVRFSIDATGPDAKRLASGGAGNVGRGRAVYHRLTSDLRVRAVTLINLMGGLTDMAPLYRAHGGLHISGLATNERLLIVAEDIGRHNTLDKRANACTMASPLETVSFSQPGDFHQKW